MHFRYNVTQRRASEYCTASCRSVTRMRYGRTETILVDVPSVLLTASSSTVRARVYVKLTSNFSFSTLLLQSLCVRLHWRLDSAQSVMISCSSTERDYFGGQFHRRIWTSVQTCHLLQRHLSHFFHISFRRLPTKRYVVCDTGIFVFSFCATSVCNIRVSLWTKQSSLCTLLYNLDLV